MSSTSDQLRHIDRGLYGQPIINSANAERMQACERRIDAERQKLQTLKHRKPGLMDDLLTGRVRVTPLLHDHGQSDSEGTT
jgi:hypothetical protein